MLMQLKDILYDIHVQLCYVCFVLIFLKIWNDEGIFFYYLDNISTFAYPFELLFFFIPLFWNKKSWKKKLKKYVLKKINQKFKIKQKNDLSWTTFDLILAMTRYVGSPTLGFGLTRRKFKLPRMKWNWGKNLFS